MSDIGVHDGEDRSDVDLAMVRVPAVIVGDHRHRHVAELGLAGELGLGHVGHADDIGAPVLAIHPALGQGRELRPLHGQVGAAHMRLDADRGGGPAQRAAQPGAGRLGEADMGDAAGAEEAAHAVHRAVDELVRQHQVARRHLLAERAAGRDRDHAGDLVAKRSVSLLYGTVDEGGGDIAPDGPGRRHAVKCRFEFLAKTKTRRQDQALQVGKGQETTAGPQDALNRGEQLVLQCLGEGGPGQSAEHAVACVVTLPLQILCRMNRAVLIDRDIGATRLSGLHEVTVHFHGKEGGVGGQLPQDPLGKDAAAGSEFDHRLGVGQIGLVRDQLSQARGAGRDGPRHAGMNDELPNEVEGVHFSATLFLALSKNKPLEARSSVQTGPNTERVSVERRLYHISHR